MALPIPKRASGFTLGNHAADVRIDAFLDIQCPYSKVAWPKLLEILEHYRDRPVNLTAHMITLSNHRQSWDVSLGLFAVAGGDAKRFFEFTSFLYERQERYFNGAFRHKTHADLIELVVELAVEFDNVDRKAIAEQMSSRETYTEARTPIRYASVRGVWSTPTFFINNGDKVPVDEESSVQDWLETIGPLLSD